MASGFFCSQAESTPARSQSKPLGSLSFCIEEKLKGCNSHLEAHIEGPYFDKANICVPILRALPEWFGIETAILHYSTEIDILPTFLAIEASHTIGFLSIKQHTPYSAEVYVMAVLPDAHHKGVGRSLMGHAHEWLKSQNIQYLQVKTLGPSDPDESYAKTRLFYEAVGFIPLEEFKQIWDEHNPCLIMVKKL